MVRHHYVKLPQRTYILTLVDARCAPSCACRTRAKLRALRVNSDQRGPRRCMEDGEIHLILTKGSKGVTWPAVFGGHTKVRVARVCDAYRRESLNLWRDESAFVS